MRFFYTCCPMPGLIRFPMLVTAINFLLRYEIWLVGGLVALTMADARFLLPACILAALFWPLRRLATGRWTMIRTPFDLSVLALIPLLLVNLAVSPAPEITNVQILRTFTGLAIFYSLMNWGNSPERLRLLLWGCVAVGIGLSSFALVSVDWAETKLPFVPTEVYRLFSARVSDLVHPNVLAGNLLLFAIITAAVFLWNPAGTRAAGAVSGVALVVMGGMIVLTQSRSSLLALVFASLLLAALRWRRGWIGLLLAGTGVAWLFLSADPVEVVDALVGQSALGGIEWRMEIWARAVYIIQDFPFTGVGMGLFDDVVNRMYPFFSINTPPLFHAHNIFLQVGVDLGVPGMVAWLSIYLLVLVAAWRVYRVGRQKGDRWLAAAGAAVAALQIAAGLQGLFDVAAWGVVRSMALLWVAWGIGGVAHRQASERYSDPS